MASSHDHSARLSERDTVGYGPSIHGNHSQRTAGDRASFLLPHLHAGMDLLDCGCGPGTITLGFAPLVAPGRVVGIDREARQVDQARKLAEGRDVRNMAFHVADVYALPFPDATFDVVFAHNVLEHLREPLVVMKEFRRVLKPGGIVAVRDPDFGVGVWVPSNPDLDEVGRLLLRVRESSGGSPFYARNQRALLMEAGFTDVEAFAFVEQQGTTNAARAFAEVFVEVLTGPATADVAIAHGWADRARLDILTDAVRAWAEHPGAFRAVLECGAIGWALRD